jgi:hypothetical protein
MATVDQLLRQLTRQSGSVPYWVLEKDYALSYLLAGIATTPALYDSLILKGGTALRKGYFADYRFSEDLDFSLRPDQSLPDVDNAVQHAVRQMELLLQQRGPFEASVERLTLREPHPGSQDAFTVRVRFPTQRQALCRLKIEVTRDELVRLPPAARSLLHSYPEELAVALWCYPLEEIVAEKLRALLQSQARLQSRGWGASRVCRDYYDLWQILRRSELEAGSLPALVLEKCRHRNVSFSSLDAFFAPELLELAHVEWDRLLRPFVPQCPAAQQVLDDLPPLLFGLWSGSGEAAP